jgi:hypothetical protein
MSELLLEAFREQAERVVSVPPFEPIESAGRARRRRRHAIVGVAAACLLAATGFLASHDESPGPQPAGGPGSSATPWPGPTMTTLSEGTYDLTPHADVALPAARVMVPDGWNAAQWGPDRFAGVGPAGAANEKALRGSAWYAGLVVTEVNLLTGKNCAWVDVMGADTEEVVSALTTLPRQEVTAGPDATTLFGRPAVHLSLQETRREPQCPLGSMLEGAQGRIGQLGLGGTYELWLVDVEDKHLLVAAGWTRNAPRNTVEELLAMADSIELHPRELPWRD